MSKSLVQFDWSQIETDIRLVLCVTAKSLATYAIMASNPEKLFLGLPADADFDLDADMNTVDITRHRIYGLTKRCYDYAYQLDGHEQADGDDWQEAMALLGHALPEYVADGTVSPLLKHSEAPLRVMLETYCARFALNNHDMSLSIPQLALLANMTVPAVRSSLSKEGFKLERGVGEGDEGAQLSSGDALRWLSKRRGFIPNRGQSSEGGEERVIRDLVLDNDMAFRAVLQKINDYLRLDAAQLSKEIQKDQNWVSAIMQGDNAEIDIDALKRLATALGAPEAAFVGRMVTHLLL